jgi:site-specific recombinase XerD
MDSQNYHEVHHSKRDALSQHEFEQLVHGAHELDDHTSLQTRFVLFLAGRLGMRKGEITHMTQSWVDEDRSMICVPGHERCIKGRESMDICGYCKQNAEQRAEYNHDMTVEDAKELAWVPKTDSAVRDIPYDFHPRVTMVIKDFFERYDAWPHSAQAVNRRVRKAAEHSDLDRRVYPHALRATAASFHAGRGLDVIPLQSLMGWAQVSTAHRYVKTTGANTARALHDIH